MRPNETERAILSKYETRNVCLLFLAGEFDQAVGEGVGNAKIHGRLFVLEKYKHQPPTWARGMDRRVPFERRLGHITTQERKLRETGCFDTLRDVFISRFMR